MRPETLATVERRDVAFEVDGTICAAWHVRAPGRPDGSPRPCVVMAHGFTMVRDARLLPYAERFAAEAGVDCLVFDYRCFGASDGRPRQWLDVNRQLEDWRAAIAFARSGALPDVDAERIALWGTSFSGGHVAAIAGRDPGLAAVISQVPFSGLGGRPPGAPRRLGHQARMVRAALADLLSDRLRGRPRTIPVVGEPDEFAAFNLPGAREQLSLLLDEGTTWQNAFTPRVILQMARYRPFARAAQIAAPWLVAVCDRDTITPAEVAVSRCAPAPDVTITRHDHEHFEVYRGAPFEELVGEQVAFLRQHLVTEAQRARR